MTRSAIDRPKNLCVIGTGVVAANGMTSIGSMTLCRPPEDFALISSRHHHVQTGLAFALIVHSDIMLGDLRNLGRFVHLPSVEMLLNTILEIVSGS